MKDAATAAANSDDDDDDDEVHRSTQPSTLRGTVNEYQLSG